MLVSLTLSLAKLERETVYKDYCTAFSICSARRNDPAAAYTAACAGGGMAANCERQRHGYCKAIDVDFPDPETTRQLFHVRLPRQDRIPVNFCYLFCDAYNTITI